MREAIDSTRAGIIDISHLAATGRFRPLPSTVNSECFLISRFFFQFDFVITYHSKSPVPDLYPSFVRNEKQGCLFTDEELTNMRSKDSRHLLPPSHSTRTGLIAWAVSNAMPSNNRAAFAEAIGKLVQVSFLPLNASPNSWAWRFNPRFI